MLALARLLGMTVGATVVALIFHVVPERAEQVSLLFGAGLAVAAAAASVLRHARTAQA